MTIINCEQRSEAWHSIRLGRITATDFQTLMSAESTKGYQDLILETAGEIITGEAEESYSNDLMERGAELEPEAVNEYQFLSGYLVKQAGFIIPDGEFSEWIGISPDGLIDGYHDGTGMIEIKCPLRKTHLRYMHENKLPSEYKHQVQAQLFVTGFDFCDFVSYYPNMKLFIVRVYPDKELHAEFENKLRKIIPEIKGKIEMYNNYQNL